MYFFYFALEMIFIVLMIQNNNCKYLHGSNPFYCVFVSYQFQIIYFHLIIFFLIYHWKEFTTNFDMRLPYHHIQWHIIIVGNFMETALSLYFRYHTIFRYSCPPPPPFPGPLIPWNILNNAMDLTKTQETHIWIDVAHLIQKNLFRHIVQISSLL